MALSVYVLYCTYLTRRLDVERAGSDLPPHLVAAHAADRAVIQIRLRPEENELVSHISGYNGRIKSI